MKKKKPGPHEPDGRYEIKFWKDWLEADLLKRQDMVEKLPFVREVQNVHKLPPKIRTHMITMMLNSFFEDLESAVYTKVRLERNKNAKPSST